MHGIRWVQTGWAVCVIGMGSALADGVLTPAHGGKIVESSGQRLELVVQENKVELYLTGHDDTPTASDGASGKVLFLAGGKKIETALKPAGNNRLVGEAPTLVAGFESAVILVEKGGKTLSARISARH
ncbi:MAG: hypothetical protein H7836_01790 [Magnetococcus sp. YQC-3]